MPEEVSVVEKSSNQVDNQNSGEIEVSLKVKGLEKENTPKSVYYAVALLLIWYAVFHDPVGFGITYTDIAGMDCDYDTSGDAIVDDLIEDLSKSCSEWKNEASAVVLIAFAGAAFCVWKANKPSKNEERVKPILENNEVQEEIVLSPLEEKKKILTGYENTKKLIVPAIAMITIIGLSLILTPQDTGLQEHAGGDEFDWIGGATPPDLMLSALGSLDVNNCMSKSSAWYSGVLEGEKHALCQDLADTAQQTILQILLILIITNILGYQYGEKKNEEITQMQDSISKMEEE